ncbi:cobalamin biosynthesis protein CbiD [Pseudomonas monsensis]
MRDETGEQPAPLRSGLTTGSCATATSLAAARLLLGSVAADAVQIVLPKGKQVQMRLEFCRLTADGAEAGTIKDAGDDPDVTHGALLYTQVRLMAEPGIRFNAGLGVGTVTRPGLVLAVGEPAINPVPRKMISDHLTLLAEETGYAGGFEVTVNVEGGEALALKNHESATGHSRWPVDSGYERHRPAVLLRGVHRLDPPGHRRRPD